MQKLLNILQKYFLPLLLAAWCAILLAQKIDLPVADIGRHIKNGEIIVQTRWAEKWQVLHQNYYSYTEPSHEFVNHHWLSGVIFYGVYELAGFEGLSIFYIAAVTLAFYLFFRAAQKQAGSSIAGILAVLVLPIIASRTEIRPEGFSYLLMAVFFWLLWHWRAGRLNPKWLFALPVLMMFWVNLHIGFIFGFLILGVFWIEELIKDLRFKIQDKNYRFFYYKLHFLTIIGILCAIAGLLNPFFIKGLLYPLNIFRQYGYLVVENQSVMFLERLGMGSTLYFGLFKILLGLAFLSFILRLIKFRTWKDFPYSDILLLGSVGILSFLAIRNFPIFGLLFLPITASNIKAVMPELKHPAYKILPAVIAIVIVIFGSFRFWESYKFKQNVFGLGLMPKVEAAAEFFKKENIQGPIFNNYDIGGYLIFKLYPQMRVFTDNRPEAYSIDHFQKDYIPAQQDNEKWVKLEELHNFNAIFFSHRDFTPWGQAFLISRVEDPQWAPVFADSYNIILVKRNEQNKALIEKFEIPKGRFGIIKQ